MKLLRKDLLNVNPNYKFYTNELKSCDIITIKELEQGDSIVHSKDYDSGLQNYRDMKENLQYAWSKPDKTYRGILYCVPKKIEVEGLREIK